MILLSFIQSGARVQMPKVPGLKVAGPTGRFKNALLKKVHHSGGKEAVKNEDVGRVVRQTLWQWGYELTLSEYERAMQA